MVLGKYLRTGTVHLDESEFDSNRLRSLYCWEKSLEFIKETISAAQPLP